MITTGSSSSSSSSGIIISSLISSLIIIISSSSCSCSSSSSRGLRKQNIPTKVQGSSRRGGSEVRICEYEISKLMEPYPSGPSRSGEDGSSSLHYTIPYYCIIYQTIPYHTIL